MEGGGLTAVNKAEIDTSAPFRSVKEAVMLFGERVLAGELKEMQDESSEDGEGAVACELKETKDSLQKAREDHIYMARCLSLLQEELNQTKTELQRLKLYHSDKRTFDFEVEDLKFIEDDSTEQMKRETTTNGDQNSIDFHKKKCVTFANPPLVAQVTMPPPRPPQPSEAVLRRHPSLKKTKKKPLIPFIGGLFSKKRGNSE